jgi:hypothetical protein
LNWSGRVDGEFGRFKSLVEDEWIWRLIGGLDHFLGFGWV